MKRNYEMMVVVRSDLTDEELDTVFKKISKKIESLKGSVSSAEVWAREKHLAFPLRSRAAGRKEYMKGCYWLVNFALDTGALSEIKETIRLEENILRNMIMAEKRTHSPGGR